MNKNIDFSIPFDPTCTAREINIDEAVSHRISHSESKLMEMNLPIKSILASTYLCHASSYVSGLMSAENFNEIVSLARMFPGNLTSFLGFECRLGDNDTRSDWAFAISGEGRDRYVLKNLFRENQLPSKYLNNPLWRQIANFTDSWANDSSPLAKKIQCFWLEFDMPKESQAIPVPSIFFGPTRLPKEVAPNDIKHYDWLFESALPLLKGGELSTKLKQHMSTCIKNIPKNASLFQIGTMLSRESKVVRFHINKLDPIQIISYLESIGWYDETGELTKLIGELTNIVDRFVVSYDITEDGIGPRIGIELSFVQPLAEQDFCWDRLFSYFIRKGWCLPERKEALLNYPGADDDEIFKTSIMKPIISASSDIDTLKSSKIIRYINHVKLVFEEGKDMELKAYPAVRLFSN